MYISTNEPIISLLSFSGIMTLDGYGNGLPVTTVKRFNQAHHEAIDCWLYHTTHDDAILGNYADYTVPNLNFKPL